MKPAHWMIAIGLVLVTGLQALAAVVEGRVTLMADGAPASDVEVQIHRKPGMHTVTESDGYYRIENLKQGIYTITCRPTGYIPARVRFSISATDTFTINLELIALNRTTGQYATLKAVVVGGPQATPVYRATVYLAGATTYSGTTNGVGVGLIKGIRPGEYRLYAKHPSHGQTEVDTIHVSPGGVQLDEVLRFFPK